MEFNGLIVFECSAVLTTESKQTQNSVLFQMLVHVKHNIETIPKRFGIVSQLFWAY